MSNRMMDRAKSIMGKLVVAYLCLLTAVELVAMWRGWDLGSGGLAYLTILVLVGCGFCISKLRKRGKGVSDDRGH